MKSYSLALIVIFSVNGAAAQPVGEATVAGVIHDEAGQPVPGVTVIATRPAEQRQSGLAVSDTDGRFRIADLLPGAYKLEAMLDGFQADSAQVSLVSDQVMNVVFELRPAVFSETVEVIGEGGRTGEVAILESRRQSAVVSDSISAEEIRRTPDSNAASVVERLTGVTLLGNKYVFVRGLGERYSGTTINGATLPTTETEKRVVALDLFPAKLLETVHVVKTYVPDKPGDFGSGVVEMTTTEFPSGATFKISLGTGYQSQATGGRFRRYAGGLGRLGEGGQALPSSIPSGFLKRRSILDPSGYSPEELETFGEALVGNWTGSEVSSASPNSDFSLSYGNTLGRLGVVLSGVSNHGFDVLEEEQRFFGVDDGMLVPINDYDLVLNREHAGTGLVGNFSLRLSGNHRLFLNSVLTRDATAEDRFQEGLHTSSGGDIRDYRVRYQLEEIVSTRFRGEHNLAGPGIGSLLEWSVARSSASNHSDLRENIYRESDPGVFELQTGFAESGKIEFFGLADDIEQGGGAYTMFFAQEQGSWSGSLKAGFDFQQRTRDFSARRFRFTTSNQLQLDLTRTPDEIFIPQNIGPNGFEIREITGVNDAYDATHTVDAFYLMTDTAYEKWRVIGGARFERSDQRVTTFNPFDLTNAVNAINENSDILPSLNVVYQLASKTNLRLGYGRSVNRPEFRELSPFAFVELAAGRSVAGNPNLKQATLDGLDVRWETFPGAGEVIAAGLFYKQIDQPIERIIQPTTDLRTSFVNADSATLWGVELEFRRSLASMLPALRLWSLNVNYAYIDSRVTVGEHQFSVVTNTKRSLEGQSDQVANVALQFHHPQRGTMLRLLSSYSGQRLTEVGAFGLPDIYESPATSFDLVFSQALGPAAKGLELKLAGTNLLDEERKFTLGGQIQRLYDPGRKVSLSLSYSPN
jgi:hypothetical protein